MLILQPLLFFNGKKAILRQIVAGLVSTCLGFGSATSSCSLQNVYPATFMYMLKFKHQLVYANYALCH